MRRSRKTLKGTKKASRIKTGLKVAAGVAVAGGALLAGRAIAKRLKGDGKRRRKRSAIFYAREIMRLKLKKRYDKIRIGA